MARRKTTASKVTEGSTSSGGVGGGPTSSNRNTKRQQSIIKKETVADEITTTTTTSRNHRLVNEEDEEEEEAASEDVDDSDRYSNACASNETKALETTSIQEKKTALKSRRRNESEETNEEKTIDYPESEEEEEEDDDDDDLENEDSDPLASSNRRKNKGPKCNGGRRRRASRSLPASRDGGESSEPSSPTPASSPALNTHFECPVCHLVLGSQHDFTQHIRQHNSEEPSTTHTCSLCGKTLSSASSLDRHMLVHSGERPFKCRICGMAFTTNGNMHRHMRTHHEGASHYPLEANSLTPSPTLPMDGSNCEASVGSPVISPPKKHRSPNKRKQQIVQKPSTDTKDSNDGIEIGLDGGRDSRNTTDENSPIGKTASKSRTSSPAPSACKRARKKLLERSKEQLNNDGNNNNVNGTVGSDCEETLLCPVCNKGFLCKVGLRKHLELHPKSDLWCRECNDPMSFSTCWALLKHLRITHSKFKDLDVGVADEVLPSRTRSSPNVLNSNSCSADVGFHHLTFVDFSAYKFPLIAKSLCEKHTRQPSSEYHKFQCIQCKKAFPCSSSLQLHQCTAHLTKLVAGDEEQHRMTKETVSSVSTVQTLDSKPTASCSDCHAVFASHRQLEGHRLRHQITEKCATPYSVEGVSKKSTKQSSPAPADLAPQINKQNFLALFELQSKTPESTSVPTDKNEWDKKRAAKKTKRSDRNNDEDQSQIKRCRKTSQDKDQGDFADIQSILAVTNTASIIPSMESSSTPIKAQVASPPPPPPPSEAPFSPKRADSAAASPELPVEPSDFLVQDSPPLNDIKNDDRVPDHSTPSVSVSSKNGCIKKQFSCTVCEKVLPNLRALKNHSRTHLESQNSFRCTFCSYHGQDETSLLNHLKTHNKERPFVCTVCQNSFTTRTNCEKHIRKRHRRLAKTDISLLIQNFTSDAPETVAEVPNTVCKRCEVDFKSVKMLRMHACSTESRVLERFQRDPSPQVEEEPCFEVNRVQSQSEGVVQIVANPPSEAPILDLSSSNTTCDWSTMRPTSHSSTIHQNYDCAMDLSDRRLNTNRPNEELSNIESLINRSTCDRRSQETTTNIPPQEQPLDLALHPVDLSMKAKTPIGPFVPINYSGMPMDLSSRGSSNGISLHAPAATSTPLRTSRVPHSLPSTFQGRGPNVFLPSSGLLPQAEGSLSSVSVIPIHSLRHSVCIGGNISVTTAAQLPPPPPPPLPPPPPPPPPPPVPGLNLPVFPSFVMPPTTTGPQISPIITHQSPQPRSSKSFSHSRARVSGGQSSMSSSSSSSGVLSHFLLKKQKQRRYRTERPFKCVHCSAGFTLRSNMERHIKQQHPQFWSSKARGRKVSLSGSPLPPQHSSSSTMASVSNADSLLASPTAVGLSYSGSSSSGGESSSHIFSSHHSPRSSSASKNDSPKTASCSPMTISTEVKQALSYQIKQRQVLELESNLTLIADMAVAAAAAAAFTSSVASSRDTPTTSSKSLPSTVKVVETKFPPMSVASRSAGDLVIKNEGTSSITAALDTEKSSQIDTDGKVLDDTEDLASVSKLVDTANRQSIQELFREQHQVEESEQVVTTPAMNSLLIGHSLSPSISHHHHPVALEASLKGEVSGSGSGNESIVVVGGDIPSSGSTCEERATLREGRRSAYVNAPNRVACPYCYRQFPWTSSLRRHILTHTGQKPFKCPHCPLLFTTKSNCDRHLSRKHSGLCHDVGSVGGVPVPMPTVAVSSSVLAAVVTANANTGDCAIRNAPDRPYRCHMCLSSTFSTLSNLQKHLITKHSMTPLQVQEQQHHQQQLQVPVSAVSNEFSPLDSGNNGGHLNIKTEYETGDGSSSVSPSERWGESEESGEDVDGLHNDNGHPHIGEPLFFCHVCLKSFAIREDCLQHLEREHPDEHVTLLCAASESSSSDVGKLSTLSVGGVVVVEKKLEDEVLRIVSTPPRLIDGQKNHGKESEAWSSSSSEEEEEEENIINPDKINSTDLESPVLRLKESEVCSQNVTVEADLKTTERPPDCEASLNTVEEEEKKLEEEDKAESEIVTKKQEESSSTNDKAENQ